MKRYLIVLCCLAVALTGYLLHDSAPEITNAVPAGETVVCFGDSLTSGYGASTGRDYPARLSQMIGEPVINAGVPGDTTASALTRIEEDVLSYDPRIVLITLGGNDLKNNVPPGEAFANLSEIIAVIQEHGALVIVGGVDVPFWGRGFEEEYKRVCRESGAVLIPNILDGILGKPQLMSDMIHPNDTGYAIMAERFYQAMEPYR